VDFDEVHDGSFQLPDRRMDAALQLFAREKADVLRYTQQSLAATRAVDSETKCSIKRSCL
jgi:hypothetical protein